MAPPESLAFEVSDVMPAESKSWPRSSGATKKSHCSQSAPNRMTHEAVSVGEQRLNGHAWRQHEVDRMFDRTWVLLRESFYAFLDDEALTRGAAIIFYTVNTKSFRTGPSNGTTPSSACSSRHCCSPSASR
jgi:hypothetical protein